MGSLVNFLPFTYFAMLLGSLAILGFPFLAGFYSKDMLLELASARYVADGAFIYLLGTSAAFFTAFYSIRLLVLVFFVESNSSRVLQPIHESGLCMSLPLGFLAVLSMFSGYLGSELFLGLGSFPLGGPGASSGLLEAAGVSPWIKNLPLLSSLLGVAVFFLWDSFFLEP